MSSSRLFRSADHLIPAEGEPLRTVVTESADAAVVAWLVLPGQTVGAHVHPDGQDTWTVLSGRGDYLMGGGARRPLAAGDIAVAHRGEVHGVHNPGPEPLVFVSVVCPAQSGYQPVDAG